MTEPTPMSSVSRLEVITTGARRRWLLDEKRRIVAESYRAPRIVSATARRHGLTPSQLFTWRRLASEGPSDRRCGRADVCPSLRDRRAASKHPDAWSGGS